MNQIEQTIEKWRQLQKLIKEEVTLSKIIAEDKKNQDITFLEWYYEYYHTIIQTETHLHPKEFNISKKADILLGDAYNPINELLMRLRLDDNVLLMIIDIIEKHHYIRKEDCNEFARFLCYQFYEDLFVSDSDEIALAFIHKMIQREINTSINLKPLTFLDETSSFLGKFLRNYANKQDTKHFVLMILSEVISKIKGSNHSFELNSSRLYDQLLVERIKNKKNEERASSASINSSQRISILDDFDATLLTKGIQKSTFGNLKSQPEYKGVAYIMNDEMFYQKESNNDTILIDTIAQIELLANKETTSENDNTNYAIPLTEIELTKRIDDLSIPEELRNIYSKHAGKNQDYTNTKFIGQLQTFTGSSQALLLLYKHSFNSIKDCIDIILNNLLTNINSIPYSIRCICRMISNEITKKFPDISKSERNAYIGEFFFRKCLTNFINVSHYATSSLKVNEKFTVILKIIQKISRYTFFTGELEWHYTLFNHYIIEIALQLNEFFDALIDVSIDFPITKVKKIFIVFNVNVILFLNTILKEHKAPFESLPNGKFFTKTIKRIANEEENLKQLITLKDKRQFFAIYDSPSTESNTDTIVQLHESEGDCTANQVAQVKFCIKCILRDLTVLNNHIYSYLNFANNNKNFLLALNQIIELEHFDTDNKMIPLNWYSINMKSNLWNDSNDYEYLYKELLSEEKVRLNMLEEEYNNNAIEMGMISQCVQNKLYKHKSILAQKNKSILIALANRIIQEASFSVCIRRIDKLQQNEDNKSKQDSKKGRNELKKSNSSYDQSKKFNKRLIEESYSYIQLTKKNECIHDKLKFLRPKIDSKKTPENTSNNYNIIDYYHCHKVKQFANCLCHFNEVKNDIMKGNQYHHILTTIEEYLKLLEEDLLADKITTTVSPQALNRNSNASQINNNLNGPKNRTKNIKSLTTEDRKFLFDYIQEYIFKKIHKEIFPQLNLEIDQTICDRLNNLSYLTKSDLNVKDNCINDTLIQFAINGLKTIDNMMTPKTKLKALDSSFTIINNSVRFTFGSDDSKLVEPVIRYIILQAKPMKLFSNLKFIRAMTNPSELTGEYGLILYQIEAAALYFIHYDKDDDGDGDGNL